MLPAREQAAIRGAIGALNAVVPYRNKVAATMAAAVTALAFEKCPQVRATGETDPLLESIKATARARKGWSEAQIEGEGAPDVQKSYDINFVAALEQMGDVLERLIKDKRLFGRAGPGWAAGGGAFASLAATFMGHTKFQPDGVRLNEKGFAEIVPGLRFQTALGLVAWAILRLSQLRAHGHVVLRCAECREFKIASIRKPQRFCSPHHRNLYNVHRYRARARQAAERKTARKPK
jgi:hypothetical protein